MTLAVKLYKSFLTFNLPSKLPAKQFVSVVR